MTKLVGHTFKYNVIYDGPQPVIKHSQLEIYVSPSKPDLFCEKLVGEDDKLLISLSIMSFWETHLIVTKDNRY